LYQGIARGGGRGGGSKRSHVVPKKGPPHRGPGVKREKLLQEGLGEKRWGGEGETKKRHIKGKWGETGAPGNKKRAKRMEKKTVTQPRGQQWMQTEVKKG